MRKMDIKKPFTASEIALWRILIKTTAALSVIFVTTIIFVLTAHTGRLWHNFFYHALLSVVNCFSLSFFPILIFIYYIAPKWQPVNEDFFKLNPAYLEIMNSLLLNQEFIAYFVAVKNQKRDLIKLELDGFQRIVTEQAEQTVEHQQQENFSTELQNLQSRLQSIK